MDKYTVSPVIFRRQMEQIAAENWRPISLEESLAAGMVNLSGRDLILTFDDGFASNRDHAWPVLQEFGFPCETFLVTDLHGGVNAWDGGQRAIWPLLTSEQVAAADRDLFTFHSHSATHPRLPNIADDQDALDAELIGSREQLAGLVDRPGNVFAYPYGNLTWRTVESVKRAGFFAACTCMQGLNRRSTNSWLLRRTEVSEKDVDLRLRIKLHTGRDFFRRPSLRPKELQLLAEAWRSRVPKIRIR